MGRQPARIIELAQPSHPRPVDMESLSRIGRVYALTAPTRKNSQDQGIPSKA